MKTVKYGNVEYKRMETLFDINDGRFNTFKQYLLQVFEKIDKPIFEVQFNKYIAQFNKMQHAEAIIDWHNFKKANDLKTLNYDAYSFCFALLHIGEGEDAQDSSTELQLEKLIQMRENGLARGEVEEVVLNFMKASPTVFGDYLEVLKQVILVLAEKI